MEWDQEEVHEQIDGKRDVPEKPHDRVGEKRARPAIADHHNKSSQQTTGPTGARPCGSSPASGRTDRRVSRGRGHQPWRCERKDQCPVEPSRSAKMGNFVAGFDREPGRKSAGNKNNDVFRGNKRGMAAFRPIDRQGE